MDNNPFAGMLAEQDEQNNPFAGMLSASDEKPEELTLWGGVKQFGRGLVRGAVEELPSAAAGLINYADTPTFDAQGKQIEDEGASAWARSVEEGAKARGAEWEESEASKRAREENPFSISGNLYEAGKMLPLSFGPGLAGATMGAAFGSIVPWFGTLAGAGAGYLVGSFASLPLFFGGQAKDTYDKVSAETRNAHPEFTDEQVHDESMKAGGLTGAIEAGGELVADLVGAKAFKFLPSGVKGQLAKAATKGFQGVKPMLSSMAKIIGTEVGTELAQGASQAEIEKAYGVGEGATWDNQKGVIMPTILMSLIGGGAVSGLSAKARYDNAKLLEDPAADPAQRMGAAQAVSRAIGQQDSELGTLFLQEATNQIAHSKPVVMMDDQFYKNLKLEDAANEVAPNPEADKLVQAGIISRLMGAHTVDDALSEALRMAEPINDAGAGTNLDSLLNGQPQGFIPADAFVRPEDPSMAVSGLPEGAIPFRANPFAQPMVVIPMAADDERGDGIAYEPPAKAETPPISLAPEPTSGLIESRAGILRLQGESPATQPVAQEGGASETVLPPISYTPPPVAEIRKSDGTPFASEKSVTASKGWRAIPEAERANYAVVPVDGGYIARYTPVEAAVTPPTALARDDMSDLARDLQNRTRTSTASIRQMTNIAANPDADRLISSPTLENGAPAVTDLGGRGLVPPEAMGATGRITLGDTKIPFQYAVVEADSLLASNNADGTPNKDYAENMDRLTAITNGRTAGLQAAYAKGAAQAYREGLDAAQTTHGVSPEIIAAMKSPVLVRLIDPGNVPKNIGDLSNTPGILGLSPVEQARTDARRLDIAGINLTDDGRITPESLRSFVAAMPESELQSLAPNGAPTPEAVIRLRNAAFFVAYRNNELVREMSESTDPDATNILNGMTKAAAGMAKLDDAGEYDIRGVVAEAASRALTASRTGRSLKDALEQRDIDDHPWMRAVMQMFADNIRSAKRIGEKLDNLARAAYAEAHVNDDEGLFGASPQRPVSQLIEEQLGVTVEGGSQQPDAGAAAEVGQPRGDVPAPVNDGRQPQAAEGRAEQPAGRGEPGAQGEGAAGALSPADGPADVSSRAGQMELANRAGTIAALKMMNNQIRKLDPTEAWHDDNIEDARDLDALREQISATLMQLQRAAQADARKPAAEMTASELLRAAADKMEGKGDATPAEKPEAPNEAPAKSNWGANNKLVTQNRAEELRKRLLERSKRLRSGLDPEDFQLAAELATFHIEAGGRAFVDFAKAMLTDLGEWIRPHLRALYEYNRYGPAASLNTDMTPTAEADKIDVNTITLEEGSPIVARYPSVEGTEIHIAKNDAGFAVSMMDTDIGEYLPTLRLFKGADAFDKAKEYAESIQKRSDPQGQGAADVQRGSSDLESDSGVATDGDREMVASDENGLGRDGQRAGRGDGRPQGAQQGGAGVRNGGAVAAGERGHQPVDSGERSARPEVGAAGSADDFGGGQLGIAGIPPDGDGVRAPGGASALGSPERAKAQRDAERIGVKPGDLQNIKDTLPLLTPGQQEDVYKAEQRFAKPEGYGMLFTNGTGTGKTFSGLGIIKRLAKQGKTNILIAAPDDKVIADWIAAAQKLGLLITRLPDTKSAGRGIVITTYANLGANDAVVRREWDLVVADEAHKLSQGKNGDPTAALQNIRAITLHPDGVTTRTRMLHRDLYDKAASLAAQIKMLESGNLNDLTQVNRLAGELRTVYTAINEAGKAVAEDVRARQGAARPRAAFLSATPFAYEKSIDWAEGYLFDYALPGARQDGARYNSGNARDQFFMTHFGYRMRYNKLTEPGPEVDRGIMQRQFNTALKTSGVLSNRLLDVEPDYDRRFVLVDSLVGRRIDDAFALIDLKRSAAREADNHEAMKAWDDIKSVIQESFDYLSRRYLLEAIKASEAVVHVREHMAMGRKVVVFHDYKKGGGFNPFDLSDIAEQPGTPTAMREAIHGFNRAFADLVGAGLHKMPSPIDVFRREFPDVLLINGNEKKADILNRYRRFNDDNSGPQVMLVQSNKSAGWSGHDTTGKHQRVILNLGQPTAPTTAIQQEGRIYRTGQASNAIIRYFNTGTNWERWTFASTIAHRASAAENLAMGEAARALKDSFIEAFEESSSEYHAGHEGEGIGGKERDRMANAAITEWDRAKTLYFGQKKRNSKNKSEEGTDYFATPEPLGVKMVEWAGLREGEAGLEPSAGHGAIARWLPDNATLTAIEPSNELRSRLALVFDGKIVDSTFEDLHITNKYDAIVMNPPFGSGGKTAVDHVAKAAQHLKAGGRIVALIPRGPAADKKFDKWFYEEDERPMRPLYTHPEHGPIYENDILTMGGFGTDLIIAGPLSIDGTGDSPRYVRPKGEPKDTAVNLTALKAIRPGKRTESYSPAAGLHLVADITLPTVTFERAGTSVAARVVVIDKRSDSSAGQASRDYSNAETIGAFFDRIENAGVPDRAAPAKPEPAAAIVSGGRGAVLPTAGAPAAADGPTYTSDAPEITYVTKKGKAIQGVIAKDLTKEQAQAIDPYTWAKDGGFFIRMKHVQRPESGVADPNLEYYLDAAVASRRSRYGDTSAQPIDQLFADPYEQTTTRPGTTEQQRMVGRAAVAGLVGRLGIASVGYRHNTAGGVAEVLGLRITANFVAGKPSSLIGQKIGSPKDLAFLAQVYRDPRFETFRMIFTRNGVVVGESGYSSRLPGAVSFPLDIFDQVRADMTRFGADAYYALHNHPTGFSLPSSEDIAFTRRLAATISGLLSHIVIDHNEFSAIEPDGKVTQHNDFDWAKERFTDNPAVPHPILGQEVSSPDAVARIAKELQVRKDMSVVVMTDGRGAVRLITSIPIDVFAGDSKPSLLRQRVLLRRMARGSGSSGHRFLILPQGHKPVPSRMLVKEGLFTDVVTSDGDSAVQLGAIINHGKDVARAGGKRMRVAEPEQDDFLSTYTQAETDQRAAEETARLKQEAKDKIKREADAQVDDFTLSGSNRDADVAASKGQQSLFSRADPAGIEAYTKAPNQTSAKILNAALVKYGLGSEWRSAYEAVTVSDALSAFGQEIQTAFGRNVRFVAPTAARFNVFNGTYLPQAPSSVYVNATAPRNLTAIAGHEIYHTLEKERPDLHAWLKEQLQRHVQHFDEYQAKLNRLIQPGEKPYGAEAATSELLADFAGDSLSDPAFLSQLAESNPSKFKRLLDAVMGYLDAALAKLKNLGSSQYIGDVQAMRDSLAEALNAYAEGRDITDVVAAEPQDSKTQTDTPEFKAWLGDSKVVDESGKPLVAVHYTANDFDTFSLEQQRQARWDERGYTTGYGRDYVFPRDGFFFFVGDAPSKVGRIDKEMKVYLSIQNPLDITKPISAEEASKIIDFINHDWDAMELGRPRSKISTKTIDGLRAAKKNGLTPQQVWDFVNDNNFSGRGQHWNRLLEFMGKDGLIFNGNSSGTIVQESLRGKGDGKTYKVAVALRPEQIKSATGNSGAFDPNNPSIIASRRDRPLWRSKLLEAITALGDKTRTGSEWNQWLNANLQKLGVKKAEIEANGITDYLQMQGKNKVSAPDIAAWLDANGVQVTETVLGSTNSELNAMNAELAGSGYSAEYDAYSEEVAYIDPDGESIEFDDMPEDVQEIIQRRIDGTVERAETEQTKFDQYQLPGGENYRELLLTLPDASISIESGGRYRVRFFDETGRDRIEHATMPQVEAFRRRGNRAEVLGPVITNNDAKNFRSSHFDQPNILAHVRFNERAAAGEGFAVKNTKSGLKGPTFNTLQEAQAYQRTMPPHYKTEIVSVAMPNRVLFIEEIQSDWGAAGRKQGFGVKNVDQGGAPQGWGNTEMTRGVPSAPFVTDTKAWVALAMKRMIRYAVDNGFDKIAWTTGEQQAARYDLSQHLDSIQYKNNGDGTYHVTARATGGRMALDDNLTEEQIERQIGKDMAGKIVAGEGAAMPKGSIQSDYKNLTGLDLKVGGEGMRAFYDNIVPQAANDLLKKMGGGRVETVMLGIEPTTARGQLKIAGAGAQESIQSGFTITDQMRDFASGGMPLFARAQGTQATYEARIDELFNGAKPSNTAGVRVLDKSDVLDMLGHGEHEVVLAEKHAVSDGKFNHPQFTAADWKKVPEWMENPIAVFERDDGNITMLAPETKNGQPIIIGMEPAAHVGGSRDPAKRYHLLLTAYNKDRGHFPAMRMFHEGQLRYLDAKRSPGFSRDSGLRLPSSADFQGFGAKIFTERNLVKYRAASPQFSRSQSPIEAVLAGQTKARTPTVWRAWVQSNLTPAQIQQSGILNHLATLGTARVTGPQILAGMSGAATGGAQPQAAIGAPQRPPATAASWNDPANTTMDAIIYRLQDRNVDLKRTQEAVRALGAQIREANDAYLKEEMYHGRTAERIDDFITDELDPLLSAMRAAGIDQAQLGEYLWARHAPEANAHIASLINGAPDGGSGMTNAEAARYMSALSPGERQTYAALAARVDAITAETRRLLSGYELLGDNELATWQQYRYYVPLNREDMDTMGHGAGTGQGFSIRGQESKRRTGSNLPVTDVLGNIANQRDKAVVRGEKNRVLQALYGLVVAHPNPGFWQADALPTERVVVPGPGGVDQIITRTEPMAKSRDNVVMLKIKDPVTGDVIEHSVTFNERNDRAVRMARSLKNLDGGDLHEVLSAFAKVTRYFASINTQYNPIFGVVNFTRDFQTAALNLTNTALAGQQSGIMRDSAAILTGAAKHGFARFDGQWETLARDFGLAGGKTGYRDLFRTGKERTEAIQHSLDPDWWTKRPWGKVLTANGFIEKPAILAVDRGVRPLFQWLSDYNYVMENSVRLAAYKAGLDSGMSKERAASIAKNLTVNFNRKGADAQQLGALYAFFNASVQGMARMVDTLRGPAGKRIIYGGILMGSLQALALAAAGFGDDEPPDFVRERNIIIPIGGGKYVTIPMPLGFNVLPNIGRLITETMLYGKTPEKAGALLGVIADAFNPLGGSAPIAQIVSPTITDPLVALGMNKDWTGKPIAREDFSNLHPTPGFTRARDTASYPAKWVAEAINTLSGGTAYTRGIASPTPDQIEYLIGQITGGAGREVGKLATTASAITSGEELPAYKIPLVGRFYGEAAGQAPQANRFYNNLRDINVQSGAVKGMREDGLDYAKYVADHPEARLGKMAGLFERRVQMLRRKKRGLIEGDADRAAVRAIDDQITEAMTRFNERVKLAQDRP